ncbi:MAG: alpha/beta hydrolase [Candidatus Levybacteria bacterium]|nr:alpha/beta hydrolase [Candidatus Levybacteria bacterium]
MAERQSSRPSRREVLRLAGFTAGSAVGFGLIGSAGAKFLADALGITSPDITPRLPFSNELSYELRNSFSVTSQDTGQDVNIIFANRRQYFEGKPVIITSGGWGSYNQRGIDQRSTGWLAYVTNHPVIRFDYIGVGGSDDLDSMQEESLHDGVLDETVKPVLGAISQFYLPGRRGYRVQVERAFIAAVSMGASAGSLVLKYAPKYRIQVERGVEVEPVGVDNLTELYKKFVSEKSFKPDTEEGFDLKEAFRQFMEFIHFGVDLGKNNAYFSYVPALSRKFVPSAFDEALRENNRLILLGGSGSESKVCPLNPTEQMVASLAAAYPGRVSWDVFEGLSHDVFARTSWSKYVDKKIQRV